MKYQRLALIGCGLMGGSFALALRQAGLVDHVVGFSASEGTRAKALKLGVIDSASGSAAEAVQGADLVLVAVPVRATEATLRAIDPVLSPAALVMDVGSTKADVVRAAEQALGERIAQFMPAHPICGKEVAGIAHADANLYKGQQLILTPLPAHSAAQIERARAVWAALGCSVKTLEPQVHDEALAAVTHFPHLLAFAFMDSLMQQADGERYLALAGPGFRDSTRIAAGDPDLWADALLANATQVIAQSQRLHQSLHALEALVQRGDRAALRLAIEQVSQRRSKWRMGQG